MICPPGIFLTIARGLQVNNLEHGDVNALQDTRGDLLDHFVGVVPDGDVDHHRVTVMVQLSVKGRL